MTPERLRQILPVLESALAVEPALRAAWLDEACRGDAALRADLESLLAEQEAAAERFDRPIADLLINRIASSDAETAGLFDPASPQPADRPFIHPLHPLNQGAVIGDRYVVERRLGRGGISDVLLARDRKLHDAQVVIKVLRAEKHEHGSTSWFARKFRDESRALSRVDHPGVVRAQDVGELPDGRPYLVMQYVAGEPLRTAISAHGMDLKRAGDLIRQIAAALAAAHEQGVIHRDLKPENIMLQTVGDEEYVKLIDFGIASVRESLSPNTALTTEAAGTAHYMAPEQLRGHPTFASDVYALGVIAYELVTGRRPFNPDSVYQLLELQREGVKIAPCDLRPSLPEAAQQAILRALSFDPSARQASARAFSDELLDGLEITERVGLTTRSATLAQGKPPRSKRRWPAIAAIVIAAASIGYFARAYRLNSAGDRAPVELPERQLRYSIELRRNPKRYPRAQTLRLAHTVIFENGDQIRLHIRSPQAGYLYVINEGPIPAGDLPSYNLLFPYALGDKFFSNAIAANEPVRIPQPSNRPEKDWLVLDEEQGVERLWLVWSARTVGELDSIKLYADQQRGGEISYREHMELVKKYLGAQAANKPDREENEQMGEIILRAKGDVLIGLLKLEHR